MFWAILRGMSEFKRCLQEEDRPARSIEKMANALLALLLALAIVFFVVSNQALLEKEEENRARQVLPDHARGLSLITER